MVSVQDCFIPKLQPIEVLRQLHDGPFGGHLGEEKTLTTFLLAGSSERC